MSTNKKITVFRIIQDIANTTAVDIENLKKQILPRYLSGFENKYSEITQKILATLAQYSDEEIQQILTIEETDGIIMILHDIREYLQTLIYLTQNKRYADLQNVINK